MTAGPTLDDFGPRRPPGDTMRRLRALDPRLRAKRAMLEGLKETTWSAARTLADHVRKLRAEHQAKKQWLDFATGGVMTGVAQVNTTPTAAQHELEWIVEEIRRLEPLAAEAEARRVAAARVSDGVGAHLDRVDPGTIMRIIVSVMRAPDLADELHGIRATLDDLARDEEAARHAPLPLDEALAALDRDLEDVAAAWRPDGGAFFWRGREAMGRHRTRLVPEPAVFLPGNPDFGIAPEVKTERTFEAFFLVAFPKVREMWREAVKASVPPAAPIPAADVPKRLAAIAERRHELAVREEAVILTAAARSMTLDRRGEADPGVVLRTLLEGLPTR